MPGTPDSKFGPSYEEGVIWEAQASDPTENLRESYVTGKGLVILEDGVVRAIGESRDASWQKGVLDRDLATPPGSPAAGDRYIVATGGTGDWAGHDGEITQWNGSAWVFTSPRRGTITYVRDENELYKQTATTSPWTWSTVDTQGGGALPTPDQIGQMLYSATSAAFTNEVPVTTEDGFIVVTDDGFIVTV